MTPLHYVLMGTLAVLIAVTVGWLLYGYDVATDDVRDEQ